MYDSDVKEEYQETFDKDATHTITFLSTTNDNLYFEVSNLHFPKCRENLLLEICR